MENAIGLLGNLVIKGKIKILTGLHIGASADTVEIGGIDSPVIKHPVTGKPYIPGSSLKGKMRSFMEKITSAVDSNFSYNREANRIWQHVCDDVDYSYKIGDNKGAKKCPICRVYGSTGNSGGKNHPSRIVVRDGILINEQELTKDNLLVFEAKMENAIDRITASASPRTFERVPAGAEFDFEIIYKVQGEFLEKGGKYELSQNDISNIGIDIKNIFEVLNLIEKDGLGGSVSRGYGKVEFELQPDECKYFKVGGGSRTFLPENKMNIDELRQDSFTNLDSQFL